MIIGLMGRIGSGKGTVSEILKEKGYKIITIGDLAREETRKKGLEPTRENTTLVSKELLRKDPAYFIKKAISKVKEGGNWVIDGIRRPLDVKLLKKELPEIKLVEVRVNPEKRFERLVKRGREGYPRTYDEFLKHEELEEKEFHISETLSHANIIIDNNGSYDQLREQVIKKLL